MFCLSQSLEPPGGKPQPSGTFAGVLSVLCAFAGIFKECRVLGGIESHSFQKRPTERFGSFSAGGVLTILPGARVETPTAPGLPHYPGREITHRRVDVAAAICLPCRSCQSAAKKTSTLIAETKPQHRATSNSSLTSDQVALRSLMPRIRRRGRAVPFYSANPVATLHSNQPIRNVSIASSAVTATPAQQMTISPVLSRLFNSFTFGLTFDHLRT